ncbi:SusC/RagA family TonB-linked outer membrane protein [Pedobacter arcticus]|uniref:SusC/RagA family TonB-linked outer membrane protein n=1 Tax=Pedobacter arcticus TaxID=752140 RepID=UPI0002E1F0BF|nr:SusC/RagA family TonB-linked outer membrane protein [Pedobacter arcticus]
MVILVSHQLAFGQSNGVKITILDDSGKPFEGVVIESVTNNKNSVMTDKSGAATLDIAVNSLIRISFSDMQKTIEVKSETVKAQLSVEDKNINLGFGTSKSVDELTSSVAVVYHNELEKSSLNNPSESLFGQLSGLMVQQNSGEPWNRNATLNVRGTGTLGNNTPLVLVDGFEQDLASVSLPEIGSVSVLKDGAALARYGQRGANGVILVTTKRGEYNSSKVSVSYDQGFNFAFRKPDFLNGYDYARSINSASVLDGNAAVYSDQDVNGFKTNENPFLLPNVNWFDETLRDYGTNANLNTSFFGGGKTVKYFALLNYQNERGLFDNTSLDKRYDSQLKYDRLNFRTNFDIDLTKTTKFLLNVSGNLNGRNEPGARASGIMDAIYSIPSAAFPVKTESGNWGGTSFYDNNPVALVSSTGVRQPNGRRISVNGQISQDLSAWVKGLSADAAVSYDNGVDYYENKTRTFLYENVSFARDPVTGEITFTNPTVYGSETDLNYGQSFGDQIRLATIFGKVNYDTKLGDGALKTSLMYHQDKRVRDGQYNTFLHQNMVALAGYSLKNRYFVDGVLSYSGSSVLPQGNRFGFFPAISAGWIVNREDFLKSNTVIDYLKLRASWGMSGNDIMSANLSEQAFGSGGDYFFNDNNSAAGGILEGRLATTGLTYENSTKTDIGIDMNLFGSLSVTLDAFYDIRKNILVSTGGAIPTALGVTAPTSNAGEVRNRGVEASILWSKSTDNFKYHIGGNFTFSKNKIINMNEEFQPYDYLKETGNSVGQQFGLQSLGFFKDQSDINNNPKQLFSDVRPGDVKYKDQNKDGFIDNLDIVPIGYASNTPEMYYALNLGYEMKGIGLDVVLQGIANKTVFLNTKSVFWPLRGNTSISSFSNNSWTPTTAETATLPRLTLLENANNYRKNDIWLTSGDYLKLRRVDLYYNFPQGLVKKIKLEKAQLYVRGSNLFSSDNIKVTDPESIGIDYPSLATYNLGIKLEF